MQTFAYEILVGVSIIFSIGFYLAGYQYVNQLLDDPRE